VMCWNYRGYGQSTEKFHQGIDPYLCKLDAERVLNFVVNKLGLRGKLGVCGRSLGGVAAGHLARTYPTYISVLIMDRTFSEVEEVGKKTLLGKPVGLLFSLFTMNWETLNPENYCLSPCFKILTCDPFDDIVQEYASLAVGVAKRLCLTNYHTAQWRKCYNILQFVYDYEAKLQDAFEVDLINVSQTKTDLEAQGGVVPDEDFRKFALEKGEETFCASDYQRQIRKIS